VSRDIEDIARRLASEADLTRSEAAAYLRLLEHGSVPALPKRSELERMEAYGLVILSGDGKRFIPVHPRLAVANRYRTWRERMVKEINNRRMRLDRLIIELIPAYEAATEKRPAKRGR
jgi:hypothetical protein